MVGPPGSGKSMLAQRLPSILPPLSPKELLEVSMIASVAGELDDGKLTDRRPFRAPHHSASMAAMVGGGMRVRPGEVSLAHHGVLFLDELPEFTPQVLDSLRQPLETGECMIARANHRVTYPARFQLVAAMNPCRCGMAGEPGYTCRARRRAAAPTTRRAFPARCSTASTSGSRCRRSRPRDLILPGRAERRRSSRSAWRAARTIQRERFERLGVTSAMTNAHCSPAVIEEIAEPDAAGLSLLREASEMLGFSARGYHRVLKVARTLADLDGQRDGRPHPSRRGDFLPHDVGAGGAGGVRSIAQLEGLLVPCPVMRPACCAAARATSYVLPRSRRWGMMPSVSDREATCAERLFQRSRRGLCRRGEGSNGTLGSRYYAAAYNGGL